MCTQAGLQGSASAGAEEGCRKCLLRFVSGLGPAAGLRDIRGISGWAVPSCSVLHKMAELVIALAPQGFWEL